MNHIRQDPRASIIDVLDELDALSGPGLESALAIADTEPGKMVVVTLENCAYCDSTGVALLLAAKRRLGAQLGVVIPAGSPVRNVFAICGLVDHLAIRDTIEDALAGRFGATGT
jgi:anti-anti-sigma factor